MAEGSGTNSVCGSGRDRVAAWSHTWSGLDVSHEIRPPLTPHPLPPREALAAALRAILQTIVELHGADRGLVAVYDAGVNTLQTAAVVGFEENVFPELDAFGAGATHESPGVRLTAGRRAVIEDTETNPSFAPFRGMALDADIRAIHSTPILTRAGRLLGVLSVYFHAPRTPTPREIQLADLCAKYAADTIEASRTQQALRDSEQRFVSFMEHLPGAAWIKDLEGRYLYANPESGRIFPVPSEQLRGKTDDDVFPPESARQFRDNDRRVIATGRAVQGIEHLRQADEIVHHSIVNKFPMPGADGKPAFVGGIAFDITDRVRAEEERREAGALLEGSIDALTSHIAILDAAGTIIKVNAAWRRFARMNGYQGAAFGVGSSYLDACTPRAGPFADGASIEAEYARHGVLGVIDGSLPSFTLEYPCHAPGEQRWFIMRVTRFGDAERPRIVVAHEDVTERREVEQIIVRNAERLRLAHDAADLGTWELDLRTQVVIVDDRCRELLGLPDASEISLRTALEAVHPDDRPEVEAAIARALDPAGDGTFEIDHRVAGAREGGPRWIRANGQAYFEEGRAVRFVGASQDITDRKRAEETLRASEERFRLLADSSPALIWLTDADHRCIWLNKAWLEFTGKPMEQGLGDGWADGIHPDDAAAALEAYNNACRAQREFRLEYRLRRHDGAYRWIIDQGFPLTGAGGRFTGYVGSSIDITDQVLARQTLERQQVLLEEAVRVRTAELEASNERLRLAERMASLGTLSAGLGHDMGNLLVPVRIRLESLSRSGLSPELQEDVEAIRTSADYLQRLANGLRMLAVDPGRAPGAEATDIATWWNDAGPLLKNALPRGIDLQPHLDPECGRIAISRAALTQAVFNLVQNAGDAMRVRGSGNVTVEVVPGAELTRILVRDNGPGMSPEVKARCMEPFFTTKPRGISTGLGLLLVYGLVREAGGTIDLQSEPGVGTTFVLSIPRAPAPPDADRTSPRKSAIVDVKDARLRAMISAELKALAFVIRAADAPTDADVLVTDNATHLAPPPPGHIVLLADVQSPPTPNNGVVTLGARPRLHAIRETLRRIASGEEA